MNKYFSQYWIDRIRTVQRKLMTPKSVLHGNRKVKNIKAGKEVVVLGNGPSVLLYPEDKLISKDLIVMNDFYKSHLATKVAPIAYCVGEPPTSSAFVDPSIFLKDKNTHYWFPYAYKPFVQAEAYSICYFYSGFGHTNWNGRSVELSRMTLGYQSTSQMAIQIAMYLGYTKISLLGFDHDWLASPNFSSHFYSDEHQENDHLNRLSYREVIQSSANLWDYYEALYVTAKLQNISIINISEGSYLDVFPFRD
jgi:hypothetical protein|tara:strand:- start:1325 stop:2077 length:753 start_codon:yes stop_codon:yes gene_type:complete